jgi:hypothetical protein
MHVDLLQSTHRHHLIIGLCLKKSKVFRINKPDAHSRRLLLIIQVTFNGSRQTDLKEENMNIHSLQKSTISGKYRSDLVIKSALAA